MEAHIALIVGPKEKFWLRNSSSGLSLYCHDSNLERRTCTNHTPLLLQIVVLLENLQNHSSWGWQDGWWVQTNLSVQVYYNQEQLQNNRTFSVAHKLSHTKYACVHLSLWAKRKRPVTYKKPVQVQNLISTLNWFGSYLNVSLFLSGQNGLVNAGAEQGRKREGEKKTATRGRWNVLFVS